MESKKKEKGLMNIGADRENGLEDVGRGKGKRDEVKAWHGLIYTTKCKIDS